jgi:hypothetical protein
MSLRQRKEIQKMLLRYGAVWLITPEVALPVQGHHAPG